MTPRERVLRAFRLKEGMPDRVPIQFEMCKPLLEHFSKKLDIPLNFNDNLYEDVSFRISGNEIRTAMGCDVVVTGAGTADAFTPHTFDDGTWLNEYRMRMKQGDVYVEVAEYPLAHAQTAEDIKNYSFPDPIAPGRYRDAEQLVAKYKQDYWIIGDIEVTIFSLAHQLVGMEKLLMDMALGAEYVEPLFAACTDFQIAIGKELIKRGCDAFWVGDDFGSQTGLLISVPMFDQLLKPHYARLVNELKAVNPDVIPILHCDGAVRKLLDAIWEVGFRVFNPVQPGVAGHSPQELKDEFGDRFAFWGAIDQQNLLPFGSDQELEKDIKSKIEILGKDRGYMISPAHILQSDVSPQRVETFVDLCLKHGKY